MKKFILFFVFTFAAMLNVSAQKERIFLFDKFTQCKVHFINRGVNVNLMNYDANNGKMYFKQGETLMELTNTANIDSINFGKRTFITYKNDFVEQFQLKKGKVRILWRIHKIHEGYEGAYGTVSQTGGQKVQLGDLGMGTIAGIQGGMYNGTYGVNDDEAGGRRMDVWKNKSANTYFFTKNGKEYELKSLKNVFKQFPEYKDQIKQFVSDNNLDMMSADKAVTIIDYILSL